MKTHHIGDVKLMHRNRSKTTEIQGTFLLAISILKWNYVTWQIYLRNPPVSTFVFPLIIFVADVVVTSETELPLITPWSPGIAETNTDSYEAYSFFSTQIFKWRENNMFVELIFNPKKKYHLIALPKGSPTAYC